jgi:hypothetical protein
MEETHLLYIIGINKELTNPEIRYVMNIAGDITLGADNKQITVSSVLNAFAISNNENVSDADPSKPISVNADTLILLPVRESDNIGDCYVANNTITIAQNTITASPGVFTPTKIDALMYSGPSTDVDAGNLTMISDKLAALRQSIHAYYRSGEAGIAADSSNANFNGLIASYIKVVNELLNVPVFKKLVSLESTAISSIFPINDRDRMSAKLETLNRVEVDFSRFRQDTTENREIIQLLFGDDRSKPTMAYDSIAWDKYHFTPSADTSVKVIHMSRFANSFLYNIKNSARNYEVLSRTKTIVPVFMNFVIENINKQTAAMEAFMKKDLNGKTFFDVITSEAVQIEINKAVRSKMKTNILTFLKIRNDDGITYNRRFDIKLNSYGKPKIMGLQYNDDNTHYYKEEGGNLVPTEAALKIFNRVGNLDMKIKENRPYDHKYIFGEFTQIFLPNQSNADIAKQMDIITNQLTAPEPKPVFILGYGASGAGKTSSLIYYNKGKTPDEQNGILIQLCDQLGKSGHYTKIDVEYREFYDSGAGKDFTYNPVNTDCDNAGFEYKNGQFVLAAEYSHKNHHTYRISKETNKACSDADVKTTTFAAGTPLGYVMIHLIDKDRHVKATTNNPNSSRSHSLIFVKLTNAASPAKAAHLIVGDFAGVENVFDCDNPAVLTDFMNIKEDKPGSNKLFYEEEKCGEQLDPIGSEAVKCDAKETKVGTVGTSSGGGSSNLPIYDFEHPSLSAEFKQVYPVLTKFNTMMDLKHAIAITRAANGIVNINDIKRVKDRAALDAFYNSKQFENYKKKYTLLNGLRAYIQPYASERDLYKKANMEYQSKLLAYNNIINKLASAASSIAVPIRTFGAESLFIEDIGKVFRNDPQTQNKLINYIKTNRIYSKVNPKNNTTLYPLLVDAFEKPEEFSQYATVRNELCKIYNDLKQVLTGNNDIISLINSEYGENTYRLVDSCTGEELIDLLAPVLPPSIKSKLDLVFGDTNESSFYQFVKEMDYNRTERLALSEAVCVNRRTEGTFINDSLKQVRNVIRDMLYEKNKDALAIMPNYIDICFDQYCPTHEKCFSFEQPRSKMRDTIPTKSVIFEQIYQYMKGSNVEYSMETLYKDLLVCVFCVFNISKRANNPPPVPYVDVNELKRIAYNYDVFDDNYRSAFVNHASNLIYTIKSKYVYTIANGSEKNRLETLKTIPVVYPETKPVYSTLKNAQDQFIPSISSFELFEFLVEHFANYPSAVVSGGGSIPLNKLIELDMRRLMILRDYAQLDRTGSTAIKTINDMPDYKKLITEYMVLFNVPPNANISYRTLASSIRKEINSLLSEEEHLTHNEHLTLYKDPFFNKYAIMQLDQEIADRNAIESQLHSTDEKHKKIMDALKLRFDTQKVELPLNPENSSEASHPEMFTISSMDSEIIRNNLRTMMEPLNKPVVFQYIRDFIEAVDNSNAVSAVGTIEFIDRLSKLNTVATVCNAESMPTGDFEKQFVMKDLFQLSMGGRRTKRVRSKSNITKKRSASTFSR